jgi:hypothetical protein
MPEKEVNENFIYLFELFIFLSFIFSAAVRVPDVWLIDLQIDFSSVLDFLTSKHINMLPVTQSLGRDPMACKAPSSVVVRVYTVLLVRCLI